MNQITVPHVEALLPPRSTIHGQYVQLQPLNPSHSDSLFQTIGGTAHQPIWKFMPDGPFLEQDAFNAAIKARSETDDPYFFAVVDSTSGEAVGHTSFLRVDLPHRCIEVGWIIFSPAVQRSRTTTEAIYLMLKVIFDHLHYRRCEWKCDDLNEPSKRAAERFGFTFEGVFRQHRIVKGFNRDSAWFSILDREWPGLRMAFEQWLNPDNFDEEGRQRRKLADFMRPKVEAATTRRISGTGSGKAI